MPTFTTDHSATDRFKTGHFTTRRLLAADMEAFRAVRSEGLVNDAASFRVSVVDDDAISPEAWRERLARDYVVAVEVPGGGGGNEQRILGIGGFARLAGTKTTHKGLIWGMYVRPEARGAGVADLVMGALLDHAKGHVRQVQLTVVAANGRAVAFYERHGFTGYGVEPASILMDGTYVDEALMWRLV